MTQQREPSAPHSNQGHELRDARARPIFLLGIGLIVLILFTLASMSWMFQYLTQREARLDVTGSPLADTREPPSGPRLQVAPALDLSVIRAEEDARLSSYGWVDREEGLVWIPIDRAMDILAERGLPALS